jgi:hypothetical protein
VACSASRVGSHAGPRTFVLGAVSEPVREPVREHLVVLAAAAGEIVFCSREFARNGGQPPIWRLRVCYSAAAETCNSIAVRRAIRAAESRGIGPPFPIPWDISRSIQINSIAYSL